MNDISIKLSMACEALEKKENLLNQILNITKSQETVFYSPESEEKDLFIKEAVKEKQKIIDQVIQIDNIFIKIFDEFNGELNKNNDIYKDKILYLQSKIKEIMDIDIKIRVIEEKNRRIMQQFKKENKANIKTLKVSKKYLIDQYSKNSKKRS